MKHKYLRLTPKGFVSCKRAYNRIRWTVFLESGILPDGVWFAVAEKLERTMLLKWKK